MMKHILVMLIAMYTYGSTVAQSAHVDSLRTYKLSKKDYYLVGTGLTLNSIYAYLEPKTPTLTAEEILRANRIMVSDLDRSATFNWSPTADKWSDFTEYISFAAPAVLLAGSSKARKEWKEVLTIISETMLINQGITGLLKVSIRRQRPFLYNEKAPIGLKYRRGVMYSFISGHTSATAAASFVTARMILDYYPETKYKWLLLGTAGFLPAITGYLRYEAGLHFLTDVAPAYALGAALGLSLIHI